MYDEQVRANKGLTVSGTDWFGGWTPPVNWPLCITKWVIHTSRFFFCYDTFTKGLFALGFTLDQQALGFTCL